MVLNDLNHLAEIEALSKQVYLCLTVAIKKNYFKFLKACAREEVIYNIEEIVKKQTETAEFQDLPDDFYDVTINDLQLIHNDLQRKM